jgi:hypothetical protein
MGKKILTFAEHLELGARIKETRKLLLDSQLRICNGLGTSSKACKILCQIVRRFDEDLKDELEEVVFRDCPDVDTKERLRVYYRPTSEDRVVLLKRPWK